MSARPRIYQKKIVELEECLRIDRMKEVSNETWKKCEEHLRDIEYKRIWLLLIEPTEQRNQHLCSVSSIIVGTS